MSNEKIENTIDADETTVEINGDMWAIMGRMKAVGAMLGPIAPDEVFIRLDCT